MDTTLSLSSPSALLSSLSPTKPSSILSREFLGCGHNLRPPGTSNCKNLLRSLRKLKKHQDSPNGSSRFCVKAASSDPHSTLFVVAAVAAVSAVSIVLAGQCNKRKSSSEVSVSSNLVLSQLAKDLVSSIIDLQTLVFGRLQTETSLKGSKNAGNKIEVTSDVALDKDSSQQFQKIDLPCDDSLMTTTSESPAANSLPSSDFFCELLEGSGATGLSFPSPVLPESVAVQPLIFATEMSKVQLEKSEHEVESDSMFPALRVKTESNAVLVPTGTACTLINERSKVNLELAYVALGQPVREELYTFYGTNQSVMKSPSKLSDLKPLSSYSSRLDHNAFSATKKNTEQKKVHLAAKGSQLTAECVEVKVPLASRKGGSCTKRKDPERVRGSLRGKERRREIPDNSRNVAHINEKHPWPEVQHSYNRFLRDGWLTECVEFLEDMDRKGLLEMNKIYHAKFFQLCKIQKAVKEAFHFTKLIANPTLSTFNMLMSVCANSQDSEGAFKVLQLVREGGLKADCKLYTTLISTCAKSGKVDAMFEVFHEMVNAGVEPNVHTYGALIDGCARAGQVAKAFGAYGIMRSKNVKPDRVVFNALITACGQAGAVDRAFDVLAEMRAETHPIDPDHITVGALIKACANAGQVDRAQEVYKMIHEYDIKGTPEVYTIALNCCSQTADWEFACNVYGDMLNKEVVPDEMFLSALIDVAGHAGKLDAAFEIVQEARKGIKLGVVSYSSLMGACCNAKNWQKALELYEDIKSIKLHPTVSTMNALITALCDGDQLHKALEILSEMKRLNLCPNSITYSILLVASEKKDDLEVGLMLFSEAKKDGVAPNLTMCSCIVGMCLRRFEKASTLGEPILSFNSALPQIDNKWTSAALMVYRETIAARVVPTVEVFSLVLACLRLPYDASLKTRLVENLGISADTSRHSNLCSLIDGFGEYDPRAFSLLEEAASLGIVPCVSFKDSPLVVDARKLQIHTAEVYLLTILKGLKHRLAAGTKLPNITILLPVEKTQIQSPNGEKLINLSGRLSQAVAALLRRLGLPFQGSESYGKIRINGLSLKRWLQPKLASPFSGTTSVLSSSQLRLGKGIIHQQRNIRTGNLSLE